MENLKNPPLYHTMEPSEVLKALETKSSGLSENEVLRRRAVYGQNELDEGKRKTVWSMFLEQFKDLMVIILLVAAAISGFMKELTDTFIILIVVLINAILGVVQESKAEKALAALKKMSSPYVKVKRNDETYQIRTEELVPGDVVLLEAGDFVPADLRLLESVSLKIEEAALTGESVAVEKMTAAIPEADMVIGDRKNMAFSGSSVTYGRGTGVITATGMKTEVGKIAAHIASHETQETPLQKKLAEMSKYLTVGIIIVSVIIFIAGVVQGRNGLEMFLIAVSLAVAAIPEGLPAVITIVLALGVQKMAKRNAIVRKLDAVETLGSTEIICSDKTGTLTQNKMTVQEIYVNGMNLAAADRAADHSDEAFFQILALCNDCRIKRTGDGQVEVQGDPTEVALVQYAADAEYPKDQLDNSYRRRSELPFDSERKLMSTVNQLGDGLRVMTKGAPDLLLERCNRMLLPEGIVPLTDEKRQAIRDANRIMAGKALRVLGTAWKDIAQLPERPSTDNLEQELIFAGLVGMIDPPRPEARAAVAVCRKAGIRPIMITGDHRDTAAAIAKDLGILTEESGIITGSELNLIPDDQFNEQISRYSVYARVSPEHKVRIVKAWQNKGKIVAMTGDGVNDAPALKTSDIGVGMGITGTDVAKGVSNMVLADDNFATIIIAVEEGRKIYSNIRKSIQFLLSSNLGEVVTLFLGTMLNWTVLLPIHILWVNLVTDTFPALALGVEKAEQDVMTQPPRKAGASFFADRVGVNIIYQGILKGLITLGAYFIGITYYSHEIATTMTFATLGLIQLTHSFNVRSNTKSLFQLGIGTNGYLIVANLVSALLQVSVILIPFLNDLFKVEQLNLTQWLIVILASFSIIPIVEAVKWFERRLDEGKQIVES
ncbi:Ca2+-transporting ATPase [Hydrogenispora ethanolica]|uniref:P-type Ca(2+) transporter n=1 Tax=Hydrogenispora ethanolica TaxID=1082276 RepID=A0A4R1R925_HYDET|nr:calcium-translocating P-type ATPase, SERCA-type [Hydrogenispora ethanolica]TCL62191.1 Ca2+-transporting ATPase [Hydrogenispora ethanolica]